MRKYITYTIIGIVILIQIIRLSSKPTPPQLVSTVTGPSMTSSFNISRSIEEGQKRSTDIIVRSENTTSSTEVSEYSLDARIAKGSKTLGDVSITRFNTLSETELTSFKGIGKVTASKIREYIEMNGELSNFDELLSIKGIGEKKLQGILGE